MTDTLTLSHRTALIDALRVTVKNAGERSSSGMTLMELLSNVKARLMLQKIDLGLEYTNEEIRAALDELLE